MRNEFNHMLVALCIADLLVILSNMVLAVKTMNPQSSLLYQLAPLSDGLCHISITTSVFLTVAITIERYYAVCAPHMFKVRVAARGHWWIIYTYIIPTIFSAIFFNIPKILQLFLQTESQTETVMCNIGAI